jgi:hypothetical protein
MKSVFVPPPWGEGDTAFAVGAPLAVANRGLAHSISQLGREIKHDPYIV